MEGGATRVDTWRFELADADSGRILHEMRWTGRRPESRTEREEAVKERGKVRTRTLGPEFVEWPDDSRWRALMARPATDWEALLERMGGEVRVKERREGPDGSVLAARLEGGGAGWSAELSWQVEGR